ncbi:MAG: efflux RND transporter permease subunit [Thermoanaerobaculia bacterium]|nr:efflux RND transporter permease subunit [Thermoanaerobaculia bacterium]
MSQQQEHSATERSRADEPPRGGPVAWFAGHHVAANLLMILILALGAMALIDSTIEVFPDFSIDTVTVRVPYLGASPSETEDGVVVRVEEAIASIQGIKEIRSQAAEGFGLVSVELDEGADNARVLDDIKAAVDRIDTFPVEIEQPIVSEIITRRQVISVVLHGDVSDRVLASLARRVRDDLTALEAISQADIKGLPPYEISIEVSEEELRRRGMTFDQVADAVRRSSLDLPGGSLENEGGEILLRTQGQRYLGDEFEDVVVLTRSDGTQVFLRDVATVIDGFEDEPISVRFDGEQGVMVQVYRIGDEDAISVTDAVKDYLASFEAPPGVEIDTWQDASTILRGRISLLIKNARLGLVLVFISLALFLDLRLAFWTTMGVPISFLGGLWLIPQFDVTINMISLFAFIVSLGIVVDDAIIVGENIYDHMERGLKPLHAAIAGAREMAVPVTFAIMTSVAAFMPMVLVEGVMGKIMRSIPIVVIMVLLMSLLESLLILPAHLAGSGDKGPSRLARALRPALRRVERVQAVFSAALQRFIHGAYAKFLETAIEWRYLTLATALAILLLTGGIVGGGFLKFSFMPPVDAENIVAYLKMPQGTPAEQTAVVVRRIEEAAHQVAEEYASEHPEVPPLIKHIAAAVGEQPSAGGGGPDSTGQSGAAGSHLAEVNVELLPSAVRGVSAESLKSRWREIVGEVPGAVALTYTASLFRSGDPISVQLAHQDFDTLLVAAERLKGMVAEYPGTFAIADSFEAGKKELELELTEQGRTLGLTLQDLARQVRQGFYGEEAQRIQRGRDEVRVMVRYPESERRSLGDLEDIRIRLADGTEVPFSTVARTHQSRGYAVIDRVDRRRVVTVTADVDIDIANANEINDAIRAGTLPQLMAEFPGLSFSFEGEQGEQQESLGSLARLFGIALLVIFALLAIPFRSYSQPLIVMSAIPFGFVGAIWGHLLMGMSLSLLSFFGIVALTGVVVNDSLIMVDLINRRRRQGIPLDLAIRESGKRRFRPILLTTLTTFMGLSPMILETSLQAQFLVPMAISLGFGVVFATAVTLVIVPVIYCILEDIHGLFGLEPVHTPDPVSEPALA